MHVLEVAKSLGKMHAENACFFEGFEAPTQNECPTGLK